MSCFPRRDGAATEPSRVKHRTVCFVASPSCVVLLAVLLALPALAQSQVRTQAKTKPGSVLAWIGGTPITRQDIDTQLDQMAPNLRGQFQTPEGRRQILDRLIEEEVWMRAAEKAGVAERPEIQNRLEQTRRNLLVRTHLQEIMQVVPAPTDSSIESYYEEHKNDADFMSQEQREVRHIQVKSRRQGRRVLSGLRRGEDFEEMALRSSRDGTTKKVGGKLGRIERGRSFGTLGRQMALAESAFAAPVGIPVGPIESSVGWHVIRVDEIIPAAPLSLEGVKPRIVALLSRELQESFYQRKLEEAKGAAGLEWNQAAVDSFVLGKKTAAELFREAQQSATSDGRIQGYQLVIEQHPQSEYAPQAQFMIGFVYSEEKKDYDKAEAAFRALLADYPDSQLVSSAEWMLKNMRSDELPEFDLPTKDSSESARSPTSPDG